MKKEKKKRTGKGDCYEANGRKMLEWFHKKSSKGWFVCHGTAVGKGRIAGVEHGHCWLEKDDCVYDFSNGSSVMMEKDAYYSLGNLKDVVKYNCQEFVEAVLKYKHWGSWHDLKIGGKSK